jgi:septum formation inhibitor MinC
MTTQKPEAGKNEAGKNEETLSNDELRQARERSEELEAENRRLKSEALRAKKAAGRYEDAAAIIEGESRVGAFFRHMNRSVLAAGSIVVGAALGVGGTVLVQSRMNRTVVGTTGSDNPEFHVTAE